MNQLFRYYHLNKKCTYKIAGNFAGIYQSAKNLMLNLKTIVLLLLTLFSFFKTNAQYSDSTHYMIGFTSTGNINKTEGNDVYLLSNALKFGIRKKSVTLNANGGWVYGETNGSLTNNDVNSSVDFDLYKTFEHFNYWGLANYTTSYSLKINNQAQIGAGVAYSIFDKPEYTVNLSDGILYENSDLQLDSVRDVYSTFRNSFRLSFKFIIRKSITISSTSYYQNSLTNGSDYILKSNNNVSVKIRKWLSLGATLSYNKFSRTNKENLLLTYGIIIEKYY